MTKIEPEELVRVFEDTKAEAVAAFRERLKEKVNERINLMNTQLQERRFTYTHEIDGAHSEIANLRNIITIIDQTP